MNRNSKNVELLAIPEIKAVLEAGKVVVIEIANTANEAYKTLFLACQVKGLGSSIVDKAKAALLGWNDGERIVRCVQNSATKIAEQLKPGDNLNDKFGANFTMKVKHSYEKSFEEQTQRATREGEALVCSKTGKPVYEIAEVVLKEDFKGHELIQAVPVSKYVAEGVSAKAILEAQA